MVSPAHEAHLNEELVRFLASGQLLCEESANWGGTLPLRTSYYLCQTLPLLRYVSSVRAIVFRGNEVLVAKQKSGHVYIIPGGRVEAGESIAQTLRRELLEETGWTVSGVRLLGCVHMHHLGPKPPDYPYPYPDFIWPIFLAEAADYDSQAIEPDEWVSESYFVPVEDALQMPITKGELRLLQAAPLLRSQAREIRWLARTVAPPYKGIGRNTTGPRRQRSSRSGPRFPSGWEKRTG